MGEVVRNEMTQGPPDKFIVCLTKTVVLVTDEGF